MNIKPKLFFILFLIAFCCSFSGKVFAITETEKQALIQQIIQQINQLNQQISQMLSAQNWCHTFYKNLGYADSGSDEVSNLHLALLREGFSYLPDSGNTYYTGTENAVEQFQAKYGISQTGYFGNLTRTKMNDLHGCSSQNLPINSNYNSNYYSNNNNNYTNNNYTDNTNDTNIFTSTACVAECVNLGSEIYAIDCYGIARKCGQNEICQRDNSGAQCVLNNVATNTNTNTTNTNTNTNTDTNTTNTNTTNTNTSTSPPPQQNNDSFNVALWEQDKNTMQTTTPAVDIKINNSDGPLTISNGVRAVITWYSARVQNCSASGDWSGNPYKEGIFIINGFLGNKDQTFTITCVSDSGQSVSDSVTVNAADTSAVSVLQTPVVELVVTSDNPASTMILPLPFPIYQYQAQTNGSVDAALGDNLNFYLILYNFKPESTCTGTMRWNWTGRSLPYLTARASGALGFSAYSVRCGVGMYSTTSDFFVTLVEPLSFSSIKVNGVNYVDGSTVNIRAGQPFSLYWNSSANASYCRVDNVNNPYNLPRMGALSNLIETATGPKKYTITCYGANYSESATGIIKGYVSKDILVNITN